MMFIPPGREREAQLLADAERAIVERDILLSGLRLTEEAWARIQAQAQQVLTATAQYNASMGHNISPQCMWRMIETLARSDADEQLLIWARREQTRQQIAALKEAAHE